MRKYKIERLLNEQKVILNNIPDGAMIFKEKERSKEPKENDEKEQKRLRID